MHKTNRFHVAMLVSALRISKRGVNISNATRLRFVGRSKVLCSVATFWRHLCVIIGVHSWWCPQIVLCAKYSRHLNKVIYFLSVP